MYSDKIKSYTVEDFYFLKIGPLWRYFWGEHPAFWCICGYLFFEYFRPQSIYPAIDILPWAQLLLVGAIGLSFFDKSSKYSGNLFSFYLVLFSIQILMSFLSAYDVSWSKNYQIDFFQWLVIYFAIIFIVRTPERFYVFLLVFIICSLKLSFGTTLTWAKRGFSFTSWGLMGPPGYFQNSGELSIQMLIFFSLSVILIRVFWEKSGRFERIVLLLSITTPALTILGASSRGSQLALAFILMLLFYRSLFKPKTAIAIIAVVGLFLNFLPEQQKDRFSTMGEDNTSQQRLLYWENGIEMIMDHPLFGVGYYNFVPYYSDHYPEDVLFVNARGERVAEMPHNIFIQIGTDAGFPALVLYLLMSMHLIRTAFKNRKINPFQSGLGLGVFAYLIAGQFVTVSYYPYFWISAALMTTLGCVNIRVFSESNR